MAPKLTFRPAKVLTLCGDDEGLLVCVDDHLAAVLVRLDAEFYGEDRGSWNLEAGFGACDVRSRDPFPRLADALAWIADRVGAPVSNTWAALGSIGDDAGGPFLSDRADD